MQGKRFVGSMIAVASGLLWTVAAGAAAQHQHTPPADSKPAAQASAPEKAQQLKVGKNGDVTFDTETLVGEMRLKPGQYYLQHRVEGSDHFVHFTEVSKPSRPGVGGVAVKAHPGDTKCRVEPLEKKTSSTAVYTKKEGETVRVQKVLIAGENVAHVF